MTNDDFCSWFDFAQIIAKSLDIDSKKIKAIDSKTFVRPAARPKFSVLSNIKWKNSGLTPLRTWQDAWKKAAPTVLISD